MLRLVLVQLINDVAFSNLLPKKRDDHLTFHHLTSFAIKK